jgi:type I restriction enzyme M protein
MLNFDVKRKINTLRDILVGKVPDPKAQVEQITIALIYKFMDDMDLEGMEFGGSREFFKEDYEKYAWSNVMQSENSGQQRLNLYAEGIEKMSINPYLPQLFRDIFRGAFIPYRDPETLNMFLKEINDFNYDHSEDLGNAFEYLLSIMGSQGDAGQFRTPRHIIDMIVEIINPQKTDSILDPACGTAGFLISSYKHILEKNKDKDGNSTLSADERRRMTDSFAGYDISPDMVRLSRVNMYLHKFAKPQIAEYDTLSSLDKWDETYDVILANPPFMTPKGGIIPHNKYRIPAKRAEVLFVDYIAEHLNPTGKAGIIVPEGIVFQSANAYKTLRKFLVEEDFLYAVISLPSGVFNPYSGVKTSVLLFDKTLAKQKDEILFVKLNNDGYDLGAQRRTISGSEVSDVIKIVKGYQNGLDISDNELVTIASKKDIAEQDYILVGERYKEAVVASSDHPMMELGEACDIFNGSTPSRTEVTYWENGNIPWFTIDDIRNQGRIIYNTEQKITDKALNETSVKLLPADTVLLCCTASIGEYAITKIPLTTNQQFNGLVIKPEYKNLLKPEYLFYMASNFNSELQRLGGQTSFKFVSIKNVKQIKIPLPPLNVQEEIVKEIEGYRRIIDGAKQVVENYKPTIKIDSSWQTVILGDMCELQSGGTPLRSNNEFWNSKDYPWYTSGELNNTYTGEPLSYISEKGLKDSSTRLFPKGSLLVGMYDTAAFKMSILDREATFNQAICGIKPNEKIDMLYLLLFFTSQKEYYLKQRVGARQRNLTKQFISELSIALPPLEIQQQIVAKVNEEMAIIEQNKRLINIFEQKIKNKICEIWGE